MNTVKEILMERDGMDEFDADDLIEEFKEELADLLESGMEGYAGYDAEQLLMCYFGLEPDYLMEFL